MPNPKMSEKFCLKWNDFQSTVSQSFRSLRQEEDFYDVTLVSEDELQLSAHKLVLSACSSFFKNILKKNIHTSPLIYLSGVSSSNLRNVLDYIYCGEVQLFQDQLDSFLDAAQKLKISGLLATVDDTKLDDNDEKKADNYIHSKDNSYQDELEEVGSPKYQNQNNIDKCYPLTSNTHHIKKDNYEEVNELVTTENGVFSCKACGKTGNDKSNMKRHAEIHIEGVSYSCPSCDKTFRSRNALNIHVSRFHKSI